MSWSGGVFTRSDGTYSGATVWLQNKNAGVKIVTTRHDTHDQDLATGINTCLTKDGQNTPTANLPMGGFRHTGVGTAQARTQYFTAAQVADNAAQWCGTAVSTAGTMFSVSNTFAGTSLTIGLRLQFISTQASTASTYISISGAGSALMTPSDGTSALATGGVGSGELVDVMYSNLAGGIFQKMNARSTSNTFTSLNVTSIGTVATMAGNPVFTGTSTMPSLNVTGIGTVATAVHTNMNVTGIGTVATMAGNPSFTGTTSMAAASVTGTMAVGTFVGNPLFTGTVTHNRTVGTTGSYAGLFNAGTLSPTQGILGVSTNSAAPVGMEGETLSVSVTGSSVSITSGTSKTIGTLAVTAGNWNGFGVISFSPSATMSEINLGISTSADALPADPDYTKLTTLFTSNSSAIFPVPSLIDVRLGTSTVYHLVARASFNGSCAVGGKMVFERRR